MRHREQVTCPRPPKSDRPLFRAPQVLGKRVLGHLLSLAALGGYKESGPLPGSRYGHVTKFGKLEPFVTTDTGIGSGIDM